MKSQVVVFPPGGDKRTIKLRQRPIAFGRSSSNELSYPNERGLSRQHAVIELEGKHWVLRDLGSLNGTYVNGERVEGKRALKHGDKVTASRLLIIYEEPEPGSGAETVRFETTEMDPQALSAEVTKLEEILAPASTRAPTAARGRVKRWTSPTAALLRAGRELVVARPLHELFEIILDLATEAVGAERGVLLTLEHGELLLQARRGEEFSISTGVRNRVLHEKLSLIIRDVQSDREWKGHESIVAQGIRSLMAVPLQTDERVIGMLYLDSPGYARPFSTEDLELLTVMANVAAMRIERERLGEIERYNQWLEAELQQAADIQQQCLPSSPPKLAGFDIAGFSVPCRTVGGDYFGYFPQPDGKLAVVVADVAGKGMPASLLMMNLQARVQVLAQEVGDPAKTVSRLHESLLDICPPNRFITLFLGVLDPEDGRFWYCNAGHDPPLLISQSGEVEALREGGGIVGCALGIPFGNGEVHLLPGDALALYSDGVTEARDRTGREFGTDRVAELFCARGQAGADEMIERVSQVVTAWLGGEPSADDVTLVVLIRESQAKTRP